MAKKHGKNAKVYVGGVDISNYLKSAGVAGTRDLADSSGLGDNDKSFVVGMNDGKMTLDGMFGAKGKEAGEVSQIADVLENLFGTGVLNATYMPQGDALGNAAKLIQGPGDHIEVTTPYNDVGKIAGSITSNIGLGAGLILKPRAKVIESKEETAIDNGAAVIKTEHGGEALLHVFSVSAGKTLVVKVQHSADNITFADLITFTSVVGATGEVSELKQLSEVTEVKRYVRALWTLTAGGEAFFQVAFARNL